MKKITTYFFLAAASWMLSTPASAFDVDPTPTQVSELTNGYYVLKTHGRGITGYIHHKASDTGRPFRQTPNYDPATSNDLTYVFKLVKDETTGYLTLQCVGTSGYMPHDTDRGQNFRNAATEENAGKFGYEAIPANATGEILDGGVLLYDSELEGKYSAHCYIHFNNDHSESNASLWDGGGMTSADHTVVEFAFYKVNDKILDVTYNLPDGTTSKGFALAGTEAPIPSTSRPANMSFYYNATITNEDKVVSETNNSFNVAYTKGDNVPFTFSTDDNETWYTINVRQAGYYLVANSSNDNVASRTNPSNDQIFNGDADWKFVESNYGVKVANKLTGKYLKAVDSNNKTTFTTKDEATEFVTIQNGSGFSLKIPGTTHCIGDHCSANLGTWANDASQADGGSRFVVTDILKSLKSSIDAQVATAQTAADESLLGHYSATEVAKIAADAEAATTIENYKAINEALQALTSTPATPDNNAYYQIINGNSISKSYISTENVTVGKDGKATEAKAIDRTTKNDAIVPQLWKFESNGEGGYKVINANTGRAFSAVSAVAVGVTDVETAEAGAITLQQLDSKVNFILKNGEHRLNAFEGDANTIVADYAGNHDTDKGNWWKIKEVTTIPVAIGESNYATVGFPFAVTIPEGVKAFIGTSTDNASLELTEIEGGIIPANTGAIIYHEGATTANFEITTGGNTIANNKLSATTAKREGFEANDTYVLAKDSEGKAALLKSELTTVPANKAFLAATEVASSEGNALAFHFGGTTTGVNSAVAGKTEGTQYFDLQGRRVLYPSNGIFVTNNGKKVFIK